MKKRRCDPREAQESHIQEHESRHRAGGRQPEETRNAHTHGRSNRCKNPLNFAPHVSSSFGKTRPSKLTDPSFQRFDRDLDPLGEGRSEEHTSELQSRPHLVCRLLLEKKKKKKNQHFNSPRIVVIFFFFF